MCHHMLLSQVEEVGYCWVDNSICNDHLVEEWHPCWTWKVLDVAVVGSRVKELYSSVDKTSHIKIADIVSDAMFLILSRCCWRACGPASTLIPRSSIDRSCVDLSSLMNSCMSCDCWSITISLRITGIVILVGIYLGLVELAVEITVGQQNIEPNSKSQAHVDLQKKWNHVV